MVFNLSFCSWHTLKYQNFIRHHRLTVLRVTTIYVFYPSALYDCLKMTLLPWASQGAYAPVTSLTACSHPSPPTRDWRGHTMLDTRGQGILGSTSSWADIITTVRNLGCSKKWFDISMTIWQHARKACFISVCPGTPVKNFILDLAPQLTAVFTIFHL